MAEADLPEEIVVNTISRLSVKSLVRFTAVSKRWCSIILFDPHFTTLLQRNKTLTRSFLFCSYRDYHPQLESPDLETMSFRKLNFPFDRVGDSVALLGSCNWSDFRHVPFRDYGVYFSAYGVGYLQATDDYKVIVNYSIRNDEEEYEYRYENEDEDNGSFVIISMKDQIWRSIKGPEDWELCGDEKGTLVNEALHWLNGPNMSESYEIVAFDFANEEFRKMQLPNYAQDGKDYSYLGVCSGGSLCVSRYPIGACDSIDFWVMTEYGVSESWTKLFSLRFSNPEHVWRMRALLITENYTVAERETITTGCHG
ncbi:PREDICTED: F-box/kelch-repeat protein At3g06240-like [Fragaria vesca subsp. vesca]|uniref:F-box/kelch-repeat protein At3g06240-like n=1 Tax=Fragaria vesca subsp. vesca TaxID=101020 RepID=UPI0002C32F3E|nr:PREDICTED: F-box/kelch-repeat protein At3g06240-like [Fragaria vesca subsp. vesca]